MPFKEIQTEASFSVMMAVPFLRITPERPFEVNLKPCSDWFDLDAGFPNLLFFLRQGNGA